MEASIASSPIKKSKSSVPLFDDRKLCDCETPVLVGNLFDAPVPEERVAIAVGKTYDGESLPAKPNLVKPVPL